MHELAVTESILEISLRHANQANAKRIKNVYLVIGQLSSIIGDSVQFYWELITDETPAAGSMLIFRRISTEMECINCHSSYHPDDFGFHCPKCGSSKVKILHGREFFIEAIDIET